MEIEQLRLIVSEQDLSLLARKHLLKNASVEDLEIHILPEGVRIKGVYSMIVPVSFEVLWKPAIESGKATARLESFRAMGMPANVLKSLIMNVIEDAVEKEPWLQVKDDVIQADVDGLLRKRGFDARTHLQSIQCEVGNLIIEAGP